MGRDVQYDKQNLTQAVRKNRCISLQWLQAYNEMVRFLVDVLSSDHLHELMSVFCNMTRFVACSIHCYRCSFLQLFCARVFLCSVQMWISFVFTCR